MKASARQIRIGGSPRESRLAVAALLGGALIWGLIWYPYRLLRDGGVDGVVAATATYAIAFVLGLLLLRRLPGGFTSSWQLLGLVGGVLLLANLLAQFGLARVAANRAIVIMLSEIAVAALAAWLLAGEALAPREWIGGAIIVAASLFIAGKESGREA